MRKHYLSERDERPEAVLSALEPWREAVVLLDGALDFEAPLVLLGLFILVSASSLLLWTLQPSFLFTLGLVCLLLASTDYLGPKILKKYVAGSWTNKKEAKYEDFCRRLLNAHDHIFRGYNFLIQLRQERPYAYFMLITPLLVIFTVLGWRINNILLAYLITIFFFLVPGLRHKGVLQIVTGRLIPFLRSSLKGSNGVQSHPPGTLDPRLSRNDSSHKMD